MNRQLSLNGVTRRALRINYVCPDICQDLDSSSGSGTSTLIDFDSTMRAAGITALEVSNYTATKLRLAWPEIPGAFSYVVYRATSEDGPFVQIIAGLRTFFYVDTPSGSGIYFYRVSGVEPNFGETELSNVASGTI